MARGKPKTAENYDISFNGEKLQVGDNVIIVHGTHLRTSVIEEILPFVEHRWYEYPRIKIQGLKFPIRASNILK